MKKKFMDVGFVPESVSELYDEYMERNKGCTFVSMPYVSIRRKSLGRKHLLMITSPKFNSPSYVCFGEPRTHRNQEEIYKLVREACGREYELSGQKVKEFPCLHTKFKVYKPRKIGKTVFATVEVPRMAPPTGLMIDFKIPSKKKGEVFAHGGLADRLQEKLVVFE